MIGPPPRSTRTDNRSPDTALFRSIWNSSGSAPAAWASSSMNDWVTNARAFEPGARSGPVGTPSGMVETSSLQFGTNRAGNWVSAMLALRSEEHTSELQSLMRLSSAVLCLTKKLVHTTQLTDL